MPSRSAAQIKNSAMATKADNKLMPSATSPSSAIDCDWQDEIDQAVYDKKQAEAKALLMKNGF